MYTNFVFLLVNYFFRVFFMDQVNFKRWHNCPILTKIVSIIYTFIRVLDS